MDNTSVFSRMEPHAPFLDIFPEDPERWTRVVYRQIKGYPDYAVGTDGTVWSRTRKTGWRWRQMKVQVDSCGYSRVGIRVDGNFKVSKVHLLVLETFICPRPEGKVACHWPDPTKTNNSLRNLRWGTQSENILEAIEWYESVGTPINRNPPKGEARKHSKLKESDVIELRRLALEGVPNKELSKRFGINEKQVSWIRNGRSWSHVQPEQFEELRASYRNALSLGKARPRIGAKGLNKEEVVQAREMHASGMTMKAIGEKLGVTRSVISSVVHRRTWKHIA